jgi:hypothetical protein
MKLWLQRNYPVILFIVLSVLIAGLAYASPGPVVAKIAVSVFAAIFISAIGHMIWSAVDQKLIGKATLRAPTAVNGGTTFRAQMRVENAALMGRLVTFLIKCERFDDDDNRWKENWNSRAVALIARGTMGAEAALVIPRDAKVTKDGAIRWEIIATIDGFQRAEFSQPINVRAGSMDFAAANELLDESRLDALEFESALIPDAAKLDPATGVWRLQTRYPVLRIVGMVCLTFAVIWFLNTFPRLNVEELFAGDAQSLSAWGELLFRLPFVFAGLVVTVIGVGFLFCRERFSVSAQGISQEIGILNWAFRRATFTPNEILGLRAIASQDTTNTLSLGVITKQGVMVLPLRIAPAELLTDPSKLRRHARWLADVIKRRDLAFDARPHQSFAPLLTLFARASATASPSGQPVRVTPSLKKIFQAIGGGLAVLAFGGFAIMVAAGIFGDQSTRSSRRNAKPVKVDAETEARIQSAIKNLLPRSAGAANNACPYEDKSYCGTLTFAARQNDVDQVKKLLVAGANPHERDANGWSPWAYVLARGNAETINAFIDIEVPVRGLQDLPFNGTQRQSVPPLVFALGHGNAGAVQTLIKRGADPNERGPYGYPAANFAAYYGNVPALKALKDSGIDLLAATPSGQPHDGETFIMHAAEGGKPEAVDYLLSLGAKASDRDPRGKDAGDHAKAYGHVALAEKLWALNKK